MVGVAALGRSGHVIVGESMEVSRGHGKCVADAAVSTIVVRCGERGCRGGQTLRPGVSWRTWGLGSKAPWSATVIPFEGGCIPS